MKITVCFKDGTQAHVSIDVDEDVNDARSYLFAKTVEAKAGTGVMRIGKLIFFIEDVKYLTVVED